MPDIHIDLDLELHDGEVRGRASDSAGGEREFAGWIGLFAAIDALLDGARSAGGEASARAALG